MLAEIQLSEAYDRQKAGGKLSRIAHELGECEGTLRRMLHNWRQARALPDVHGAKRALVIKYPHEMAEDLCDHLKLYYGILTTPQAIEEVRRRLIEKGVLKWVQGVLFNIEPIELPKMRVVHRRARKVSRHVRSGPRELNSQV